MEKHKQYADLARQSVLNYKAKQFGQVQKLLAEIKELEEQAEPIARQLTETGDESLFKKLEDYSNQLGRKYAFVRNADFHYRTAVHFELPGILGINGQAKFSEHTSEGANTGNSGKRFIESIAAPEVIAKVPAKFKKLDSGQRSFARHDEIYLWEHADTATAVHELGHVIEHTTDIGKASKAYLNDRARRSLEYGRKIDGLRDTQKSQGYEPDEVAADADFINPYSAKYYRAAQSTEILSMGLQHLYEDPIGFAEKDPDHFNYTILAITGRLSEGQ
jgi:hypothetical protein